MSERRPLAPKMPSEVMESTAMRNADRLGGRAHGGWQGGRQRGTRWLKSRKACRPSQAAPPDGHHRHVVKGALVDVRQVAQLTGEGGTCGGSCAGVTCGNRGKTCLKFMQQCRQAQAA